jgi:hypothetical protein
MLFAGRVPFTRRGSPFKMALSIIPNIMRNFSNAFHRRVLAGAFSAALLSFIAPILPLSATTIAVPNFSFESPALPPGANNGGGNGDTTSITSWTIAAPAGNTNNGVYHPVSGFTSTNPLPAPADGNQIAYLVPGAGNTSSITTSNSLGLIAANTTYMLTVALGNRNDTQILTFDTGLYTINILANGVSVAQSTLAGSMVAHGTFSDLSTSFLSPNSGLLIGESLTLRLSATGGSANDEGIFDNVRLTATTAVTSVPDSGGTMMLLSIGILGLGMFRPRRAERAAFAYRLSVNGYRVRSLKR